MTLANENMFKTNNKNNRIPNKTFEVLTITQEKTFKFFGKTFLFFESLEGFAL